MADAQGLVGPFAGVDVLNGAEDAPRAFRRAERDAFGPEGDPDPFAAVVEDAVFDLDEGGFAAEVGLNDLAHERLVVRVQQIEPGRAGGGHVAGIVADEVPDTRRAEQVVGLEVPLIDADLGGIEGEIEAFVGGLEAGLDPAALLVFRAQLLAGVFGGALATTGGLGQIDHEAEQGAQAQAGEERQLGQVLPVGIKIAGAGREGVGEVLSGQAIGNSLAQALINVLDRGHGRVNLEFAGRHGRGGGLGDGDGELITSRKIEPPVDDVEKLVIVEFPHNEAGETGLAHHGGIHRKRRGLQGRLEWGGDGRAAGLTGGGDGGAADGIYRVVVKGRVLIAPMRPIPACVQPGIDPHDGAIALEIAQIFGGVRLPLLLRGAGGLGPEPGHARQTADMGFGLAVEERRDVVAGEQGGAVGVAQLALPQGDPESDCQGRPVDHDR